MKLSKELAKLLEQAETHAKKERAEFLIPEHIMMEFSRTKKFEEVFSKLGGDIEIFRAELQESIDEVEKSSSLEISGAVHEILAFAIIDSIGRGKVEADMISCLVGLVKQPDSYIADCLVNQGIDTNDFIVEYLKSSETESKEEIEEEPKGWKKYVKNFQKIAAQKKEPLVGREKEIDDTVRILCRKEKSNPLHVGEPGVGKTAITLGLAKRINEGKVPEKLKNKKIYELEMATLLAGARFKGDFEERLKEVLKGATEEGDVILYIDEIHTIVGAGRGSEDSMDAGNILKKALLDGKISFIGATTYEEYRKYMQKDKALERRFKTIDVVEPTQAETVEILKGIRPYYEEFHGVSYSDKVLEKAVELSVKYMNDRFLPDKAIDIIDEAGATISKDLLIKPATKTKISEKLIEEIIARTCKIPATTVKTSETKKLLGLESDIKKVVFGQDEAIKVTTNAIKMARAGLNIGTKPIANLLYVGPTGVGKTEVAKQLAENMGCDLIRFDMSEYMDETAVNKFIGSSAGYVGYEDGGLLVEAIRKHPHCVLLLDEIEKAHPKIFNILLQVMDYATLTDNKGRKADFKNVVIIMTSNAGAHIKKKNSLGFCSSTPSFEDSAINEELTKLLPPEFRSRLTKVVEFQPLSEEMGKQIVTSQLTNLVNLLSEKGVKLSYTDNVTDYVAKKGITPDKGARNIIWVVENDLKPIFVDGLLDGSLKSKKNITLDIKDEKPVLV